ncbi:MAG TPA: phosphate ABC transporter permease PstA [Candidatus Caenarcaniphilales bacterium]|nr:phosphate ABC transporter permease PstA [Candidatus Caenarcaniphilales bacterium]
MATQAPAQRRSPAEEAVYRSLHGRRLDLGSIWFQALLLGSLIVVIGVLVSLIADVVQRGAPIFAERGLDFLTGNLSSRPESAGVRQGIVGSLLLVGMVILLAFPIGIGAGIYLEEYARDTRLTRLLNASVRNLAGVPAIVYGLLGLSIFVVALSPLTGGRSVIAGGLTLAVLVMPIVIITTAEALRAVPRSIREAGYGVGATKWEVTRHHVLPYAAPGILTGSILTLSRAFGETAPLILAGAVLGGFATAPGKSAIEELQGPYTALPTIVFNWARQPSDEFRALTAAAIIVLLVIMLLLNAVAIILRSRFERNW